MDNKEHLKPSAGTSLNISKQSISIDKKNHDRPNIPKKNQEHLIAKQVIMNGSIERKLQPLFKDMVQKSYGDVESLYFTFRNTIVVFKDRLSADKAVQNKYFDFENRSFVVNRMFYLFVPKVSKQKHKKKELFIKKDPEEFNYEGTFDTQLQMMIKTVEMSLQKLSELDLLLSDIKDVLLKEFPGCQVIPFGSIMTGMAFTESDVDCFVLIDPDQMKALDKTYKDLLHSRLVNRSKKIFEKSIKFTKVISIPRASVPIVKLYHLETRFNCDISFKNGFGVHNSKLISFILSSNTRLKPLTLFIKYWAKTYDLTSASKFSNYAIMLLIIFFLQQVTPSILGPICDLQNDNRFDIFIDLWNCGFDYVNELPKTENSLPVLILLRDFFGFYKSFDFANNVICPFVGKAIPMTTFNNLKSLLPSYKSYVQYVREGIVRHITISKKSIYLQDPFEHDRNCTLSACRKSVAKFIHHCNLSHKIIEEAVETNNYDGIIKNLLNQKPLIFPKKNWDKIKKSIIVPFPKIKNATFDMDLLIFNMKTLFMSIFDDMLKCKWTLISDKAITKKDVQGHFLEYDCTFSYSVWSNRKPYYKNVPLIDPLAREIEVTSTVLKMESENPPVLFDCKLTVEIGNNTVTIILEKKPGVEDNSHFYFFVTVFDVKLRKIITNFLLKQKYTLK